MTVYVLSICSIFVWTAILALTKLKERDLIFVSIVSVQLIILSSFRSSLVGSDTINYINRFLIIAATEWKNVPYLSDLVDFENGFILMNKLIGSISTNQVFFLAVNSLVIIIPLSIYIYKKSTSVWLSFFIFIGLGFWGDSMNILRQMLALVVLVRSLQYVEKKQLFRFVIAVLIASTLHISAIAFFVVYPLSYIRINRTYLIGVLIASVATYLVADKIIIFLLSVLGYQYHFARIGTSSGGGMLLMLMMFAFVALYARDEAIEKHKDFDLYLHLLFVGILLNILAINFALAGRAMIYFTIHNIILIPKVLDSIYRPFDKYVGTIIVVIGVLYFYLFRLLVVDVSGVVPYIFN